MKRIDFIKSLVVAPLITLIPVDDISNKSSKKFDAQEYRTKCDPYATFRGPLLIIGDSVAAGIESGFFDPHIVTPEYTFPKIKS